MITYRLKALARVLAGLVLVLWGVATLPLALLLQFVQGFRTGRAANFTGQELVNAAERVDAPAPSGFAQFVRDTEKRGDGPRFLN